MDGPIDWWWKMNLLDVCVQAGFCQIRSQLNIIAFRAGRYTTEKSKRRYFCHTGIEIERKILYRQTDIP